MKSAGQVFQRQSAKSKGKSKPVYIYGFVLDAGKDEDGKRRQIRRSGFATKREAQDALMEALRQQETPAAIEQEPEAPGRTFGEFITEWLNDPARAVTPRTLEQYQQSAAYLTRPLGEMPLSQVTPRVLEKAIWELLASGGRDRKGEPRPLAPKTVRHAAFVVHGAYETAFRLEEIDANPMKRVKLPPLDKRDPSTFSLPREDVARLLHVAEGTELYPLVVLALTSGCRRGEMLSLRWQNVNLDTGVMTIATSLEQTKSGLRVKGTKSGKPRDVHLPASAVQVLKLHQIEQQQQQQKARALFGPDFKDLGLVFCRPDGDYLRPDRVSSAFCGLARKVGLEIGLHELRHQHASESLSAGAPLPAVAARLGHANADVTAKIYAHAHSDDSSRVAEQWDAAYGQAIRKGFDSTRTM